MAKSSVAVLDIRSSEITAAIGSRGVNGTFIIKSKFTSRYEGFAEGELIDENSFNAAVKEAVNNVLSAVDDKIKSFTVSVPGEFISVINADKTISFASSKKIRHTDVNSLVALSQPQCGKDYEIIFCSPQYYVLSDKRRTVNPEGNVSDTLRGKLSFYFGKSSFLKCVKNAFKDFEKIKINFVPSFYAESTYLLSTEKRDEYSVLFDFGFISSTYSVVCGNGVTFSESFSVGVGHFAVYLMTELEIPYAVSLELLKQINLNCRDRVNQLVDCRVDGKVYSFSASLLREKVRECLDGVCEILEECKQNYTGANVSGKTIYVTGDCINTVKGTTEHLSDRLGKPVEIISPPLPYYDKPQFSSLFSLLNFALNTD